ncbi:unnamed protein product, partial [Closterium sp. NIES-54]
MGRRGRGGRMGQQELGLLEQPQEQQGRGLGARKWQFLAAAGAAVLVGGAVVMAAQRHQRLRTTGASSDWESENPRRRSSDSQSQGKGKGSAEAGLESAVGKVESEGGFSHWLASMPTGAKLTEKEFDERFKELEKEAVEVEEEFLRCLGPAYNEYGDNDDDEEEMMSFIAAVTSKPAPTLTNSVVRTNPAVQTRPAAIAQGSTGSAAAAAAAGSVAIEAASKRNAGGAAGAGRGIRTLPEATTNGKTLARGSAGTDRFDKWAPFDEAHLTIDPFEGRNGACERSSSNAAGVIAARGKGSSSSSNHSNVSGVNGTRATMSSSNSRLSSHGACERGSSSSGKGSSRDNGRENSSGSSSSSGTHRFSSPPRKESQQRLVPDLLVRRSTQGKASSSNRDSRSIGRNAARSVFEAPGMAVAPGAAVAAAAGGRVRGMAGGTAAGQRRAAFRISEELAARFALSTVLPCPAAPSDFGAGSGGAEPERAEPGGARSEGAEPGVAECGGAEPDGAGLGGPSGAS